MLVHQSNDRFLIELNKQIKIIKTNNIKEFSKCLPYHIKTGNTYFFSFIKGYDKISIIIHSIIDVIDSHAKILIVDDESDYASININNKGCSRIYSLLNDLKKNKNIQYN